MADEKSYTGKCFCGAIEVTVTGEPVAMGYCHCLSCQAWSAAPVYALTLWPPEKVQVTKGAESVASYQKTETSIRKWCKVCGGHILSEHPLWGVTDVPAVLLRDLPFEPAAHANYGEASLRIGDGLPKQKDYPAELGGSGVLLPE